MPHMPIPLKTVFMGTPEIAVPALRLLAARTDVTCVITQPDRPAGRGMHLTPPAVKAAALELGLPVWQPATMKEQQGDPRLECDLAVVMAYGELLRQPVLDRPRHGCINLHASLLPRWRGASPLQAALRAGDARTGVTVMRMVRALDAGAMFLADEIPIGPRATLPELHDALADSASRALGRFLDGFPGLEPVEQDPALVTTCHKLTAEHGRLDFQVSATELDRWIRAYTPAPGCWVPLGSDRLKLLAAQPAERTLAVGAVLIEDGRLFIGCGQGALEILRLQAPGKKALDTGDFLRGSTLPGQLA
jgi:methionyl-tRNA formyltransferase